MNKRFGMALVLITLVALGFAIQSQLQLRKARDVVAEDLSGNEAPDQPIGVPSVPGTGDAQRIQLLLQQVAALQAERDQLVADLAAAQSARTGQVRKLVQPVVPVTR